MLGQRCTNVIQMFCVCWVTTLVQHWRWWGFRQICCVRAVMLRNSHQIRRKGGMGSLAFMAGRLTRMRVVWIQCRSLMEVKREILKFDVFEADLLSDSIFLGLTFVNCIVYFYYSDMYKQIQWQYKYVYNIVPSPFGLISHSKMYVVKKKHICWTKQPKINIITQYCKSQQTPGST